MNRNKAGLVVAAAFLCAGCGARMIRPETNTPRSHEARLVEVSSACEWMVLATGVGAGPEASWDSEANQDARKAAVQFILDGGDDPLLQTAEERRQFTFMAEEFFAEDTYPRFIAWEQTKYESRVRFEDPRQLRVTKHFRINRCALQSYLIAQGVVRKRDDAALGMPTIAVMPEIGGAGDDLAVLMSYPSYRHAVTVLEGHLTARRYDVVVLDQKKDVDDIIGETKLYRDAFTDNEYIVANSMGSDIYLVFTLDENPGMAGGREVNQVVAGVKAFETTTGRLLGSASGYSTESAASRDALIEEALNDAVAKTLSRVEAYWKQDMQKGIQYRIHLSLDPQVSAAGRDHAQMKFIEILRANCRTVKETTMTDHTADFTVWVDADAAMALSDLYARLRTDVAGELPGVRLERLLLMRKVALLRITRG